MNKNPIDLLFTRSWQYKESTLNIGRVSNFVVTGHLFDHNLAAYTSYTRLYTIYIQSRTDPFAFTYSHSLLFLYKLQSVTEKKYYNSLQKNIE